MNRRPIHGVYGRRMGVHAHSAPIPHLCDGLVTPLDTLGVDTFIDVRPMESSKAYGIVLLHAYATPMIFNGE